MNRITSAVNVLGMNLYYQNASAWPGTNYHVLSVNYYDNYNQLGISNLPTTIFEQPLLTTTQVKGMSTWQEVRVLEATTNVNRQKSYTLYDSKARPIYNLITFVSSNHWGFCSQVFG